MPAAAASPPPYPTGGYAAPGRAGRPAMSVSYLLTTRDAALAAAWVRQLPEPPVVPTDEEALIRDLQRAGPRVWIKDLADSRARYVPHRETLVVAVGEPKSIPYEDARGDPGNAMCLSYEESTTNLRSLVRVVAELAESRAVAALVSARLSRPSSSASPFPDSGSRNFAELEFIEAAVDRLEDQAFVLDVFRRGFRARLRASRVTFFLREEKRFVAQPEEWECPRSDPFVFWLQEHAAIVDSQALGALDNPAAEVLVRRRMAEWNARLLVPIEVHGTLAGWVVFGPRADARQYSTSDREDALWFTGLFARVLGQQKVLQSALATQHEARLLQRYGPKVRVIRDDGGDAMGLPVEVRETLGLARREGHRVDREFGRLRVSAAPIPEERACWVLWDEEGGAAESTARKLESERHRILHDLGLILSHELANALFSVSAYFQHIRKGTAETALPESLLQQVDRDMLRLKEMPHILETLHAMAREPTASVEMRRLVESVAEQVDGSADVPTTPVTLWGHEEKLRQALIWLCREVRGTPAGGPPVESKIRITLQQRHRPGSEAICLVSIAYPGLRVDQIKAGEPEHPSEYPTMPIYLAREVIRFHYGTIHVGQGIDGPELHVALKSRPDAASRTRESASEA